ncbi:3-deoxy-7-phosphoheptulonate synthase [Shewanella sp. 202IG2-18]|uniref:3-deoxy-7-phosphoheptulonate synthase n=1 Tax=Parashewanella hymeniacidonis TaxID=2807618 RepID=UPI00195FD747|nr:3-deoxy-7-phosphoheptulonate synthase [Parashewanella hymeniacidonis]MBM7074042.1 3-deoxy-7-phosphoheptulonate synthase [Parashewanella hymeniacidonis]
MTQLNILPRTEAPKAANDSRAKKVLSPLQVKNLLPVSEDIMVSVEHSKQQIRDILNGKDDRLLVVTGPCSIHDEAAALEYGQKLAELNEKLSDKLLIVMRTYVEKPRTSVGWKGFAYDPVRDGCGNMEQGLLRSRKLMLQLAQLGLPLATEALNPLVMMYMDDVISWVAIGARTSESQTHREMVSNLNIPVGIKNNTNGSADTAINAMISAGHSHHTLGLNRQGEIAMIDTPSNPDTHLVLRGGKTATGEVITNYDEKSIEEAVATLTDKNVHTKVMIDCSHDNAQKQHLKQIDIALHVAQLKRKGNQNILGIMLESFIEEGKQSMDGKLVYGKSITDACISWAQTEKLLNCLTV